VYKNILNFKTKTFTEKPMISRLICFAYVFFVPASIFAQTESAEQQKSVSKYLLADFTQAKVLLKSGKSSTASMNYNVLTKELDFQQSGKRLILENNIVDTVYLQTRKLVPGVSETAFFEIFGGGRTAIYLQHAMAIEQQKGDMGYGNSETSLIREMSPISRLEGRKKTVGSSQSTTESLNNITLEKGQKLTDVSKFWLKKNEKFIQITNINQVIKNFPGKEIVIENFIKTEKISFARKEDMIKLIEYCSR
jgi:hypothetical protein